MRILLEASLDHLWPPFFIAGSRWVRVTLKGFYERGAVYSPNGSRAANSVKLIFGTGFLASRKDNIQAKGRKGNHNLLGVAPAI